MTERVEVGFDESHSSVHPVPLSPEVEVTSAATVTNVTLGFEVCYFTRVLQVSQGVITFDSEFCQKLAWRLYS